MAHPSLAAFGLPLTPLLPTVAIYTLLQQAPVFLCQTEVRERSEATEKQARASRCPLASALLPRHGMEAWGSCAGCGWRAKAEWPCTTQQVLNWGSDSWRCRSDTQLGALNQAQKSILSQRLGGVCDQHGTALHCSRALSWGPLCYLAPVSQHSLDQPNGSAAPQASKTSHWVEMPRALAVSVAGGLQGHGSSVCVPEPLLWFPPTAPNGVGTCCWKGPSWTAAALSALLQLWQLLALVCRQN